MELEARRLVRGDEAARHLVHSHGIRGGTLLATKPAGLLTSVAPMHDTLLSSQSHPGSRLAAHTLVTAGGRG